MTRSFEVDVNPSIIKWARETAGWSIEEVAARLKTSVENYKKIESGEKKPTYRQLKILSKCFKRPVSVFLLPAPPAEKPLVSSFRLLPKSESLYSKEFRLALRKARYYQTISSELMDALDYDKTFPIAEYTPEDSPVAAAQKERKTSDIPTEMQLKWKNAYEAFNIWRRFVESKNILVFQFKFPMEDGRGFCLMGAPPVIVVNSSDNILARIFTLFHEYAHVLLGISEVYSEDITMHKDIENWCNMFAAEFLIPEDVLRKDQDFKIFLQLEEKEKVLEILRNLSRKYKISKKAILVRLKTLNLISRRRYEVLSQVIEEEVIEERKGYFLSPEKKCILEKGEKFVSTVLEAEHKGFLTTHEAMEYLSLKLKYIDKIQKTVAAF